MSRARVYARAILFSLSVISGLANAASTNDPSPDLSATERANTIYGREGQYRELLKRVTSAQTDQYVVILAEYDNYLVTHADDVVAHLEKCRFIHQFSDAEDFTIEGAEADAERCDEALRAMSIDNDGRVQLYLLDQMYGDALVAEAEKLLPEAYPWPQPLRARLYETRGRAPEKKPRYRGSKVGQRGATGSAVITTPASGPALSEAWR